MHESLHRAPRRDRGTVLIVTMWIVLVMAGLVLVLARTVRVADQASANRVAGVRGGEHRARGAAVRPLRGGQHAGRAGPG